MQYCIVPSPAQLSTFSLVSIMSFCYFHAHAVLIDSISIMLQSVVTGIVSMQPLQEHEVSTVC